MRILIVLTYYRPHTSGLTIYAERLAKALAQRGHAVTVMTSQFDKNLARDEYVDGVHIVRVPVLLRLSKGVIMPRFGMMANRLVKENDWIQLHLPQFDAAGVALRGRISKKPTIITYHCDLRMPQGLLNWAANRGVIWMNELAAKFTHRIVTYTQDYAENSSYLRRYLKKLKVIPPPVELPSASLEEIQAFKVKTNPDDFHPVIGMAARFATEKGVEVLLDALPEVLKVFPKVQVQFAGTFQNIIGEQAYFNRLISRINDYQVSGNWIFLGNLTPRQMASYYPNLDVLVLPSLNSTEAFGLVQIEAMLNGVPCIASNLPGVRQPVRIHKMGQVVPIGDSTALAKALIEVLSNRSAYIQNSDPIREQYMPETIAIEYEKLFTEIAAEINE